MDVIKLLAKAYGYFPPKKKAERGCGYFLKGKHMFVCLPTGFGKSTCYGIFDLINDAASRSTVYFSNKACSVGVFVPFGYRSPFKKHHNLSISQNLPVFQYSLYATCQAT